MDWDSPWKDVVEQDADRVIAFFWPDIHADLDWAQDVESKEQEFRKLDPRAATGKRIVDKLLKVIQKGTGDPRFLHLEVQAQAEGDFERRIHVYNYRAEDHVGQPVVSLPILIDDDPAWRPTKYEAEVYGTRRTLTFRSVKILDWRGREAELEVHPNPVALFVLAHLEGRRLEDDTAERARVKLRIIQNLLGRGLDGDEMRHWYRYLAFLLPLPEEYDLALWQELERTQKEGQMPLPTFADRYYGAIEHKKGIEKGERKGLLKGISLGLKLKFGQEGMALMPQIETVEDLATLDAITNAIEPAGTLDDIRKLLPAPAAGQNGQS